MSHEELPIQIARDAGEHEKRPQNKMLAKAIENRDVTYIQEFLAGEGRHAEVQALGMPQKKKLLMVLVEFLDQPQRLEAVQCMYEILQSAGSVDELSRRLVERTHDFNKLVYLKGKIDYLRYVERSSGCSEPENEYTERK